MKSETEALKERILALPPDERAILAQEVWDSIEHFADPEVEKAWLDEAERRWIEIEERKVETISAEEALRRAKKRIAK
jgi:putative addiction module component (TIGR02574 family)